MNAENESLLRSAHSLLDRFMFEGNELREGVSNLKIDDTLPSPDEAQVANVVVEQRVDVAA